jgi:16S rRNA C967 or C1407 C5-methylase (RsmB/RsmF family)
MTQLPDDFIRQTRDTMGDDRFERFLQALDEESPVSIRVRVESSEMRVERVPWCPYGFYLSTRPAFTFDPLLHAGCYYVQEASSMFLYEVLRQHLPAEPLAMLDLCAAPGGKSTLIRSVLSDESLLVSNEPVRPRHQILLENVTKWGGKNHLVTNNLPADFRKAHALFDAILCDVPCSGEGMFRKDAGAVAEWSLRNVERCQQLQREIVGEAWQCLREGGILIYSTCTFNILENEANIRWMQEELGAEVLPVETQPEWGITGSLLKGFDQPVYRFIPGFTRGEGLFMAVVRLPGVRLPVVRPYFSPTPPPLPTFAARPSCCRPTCRAAWSPWALWASRSDR